MIIKRESKSAFETSMAFVDFCIIRSLDGFHFTILHGYIQIATYTAIRAYSSDFRVYGNGFRFKNIGDRRSRTSLSTCSATHTFRFKETLIKSFDNMAVKSAAGHTQYKFTLHFIASPDTTETIDAF